MDSHYNGTKLVFIEKKNIKFYYNSMNRNVLTTRMNRKY